MLATKEIFGKAQYDNLDVETRQLDYYKNQGVTPSSYASAIKQLNNSNSYWWLRSASRDDARAFLSIVITGDWGNYYADFSNGVSPAFRMA